MNTSVAGNIYSRSRRCIANTVRFSLQKVVTSHIIRIGPIVRIDPYELSINDPDAYNDIYVPESRRRTEAYDAFAKGIGVDSQWIRLTR